MIPETIRREAGLMKRLELLAREIGEASLDAMHATKGEERKAIAQRLRALADKLEAQ